MIWQTTYRYITVKYKKEQNIYAVPENLIDRKHVGSPSKLNGDCFNVLDNHIDILLVFLVTVISWKY